MWAVACNGKVDIDACLARAMHRGKRMNMPFRWMKARNGDQMEQARLIGSMLAQRLEVLVNYAHARYENAVARYRRLIENLGA